MLVAKMPRPTSESHVVTLGMAKVQGRSIAIIVSSKIALDDTV